MELPLSISATPARYKFFFTSIAQNPNPFPCIICNPRRDSRVYIQAKDTETGDGRTKVSFSKKPWIRQRGLRRTEVGREREEEDDDEEVDEEESNSGDEANFLSLSMKPDRNVALLDEYEMEELDYSAEPNHRSGMFSVP